MPKKPGKKNTQERRSLFFAAIAVLVCIVASIFYGGDQLPTLQAWMETFLGTPSSSAPSSSDAEGKLAVHFIDVGQGDCILVQAGKQNILIDAGERGNGETIINYLHQQDVGQLDLLVASHPHSDHIGSMPEVLKEFGAKELLSGNVPDEMIPTTRIYEKLLDATEEQNTPVKEALPGMEYSFDNGAIITVVGPIPDVAKDLNNTSVVFRLDFGETSFLFTGDAEEESEEAILKGAYREKLHADVLKLGHHGSSTSTSEKWLDKVAPSYAIALLGKDNDYGHPHKEILQKLSERQIPLYRSDLSGNIVFTSDGKMLEISTQYS